jgi:hypothetical protein
VIASPRVGRYAFVLMSDDTRNDTDQAMIWVILDEAKKQLDDLIDAALRGETVFVECGAAHNNGGVSLGFAGGRSGRREFGSMRGTFSIADNFDDPLEDFDEYQ